MPRASITFIFIPLLALALPTILLSGCVSTRCEEWRTRVETVSVCNTKGVNCSLQEKSVQYCARKGGQRAEPASAPDGKERSASGLQPKEVRETRAPDGIGKPDPTPYQPEQDRRTPAPEKIGIADPTPYQPEADRRTQTLDKIGMPNLTPFWQSLFSASRYSGLPYGKVERVTMGPATTPASSPKIEAALKTHVRAVVSMRVVSNSTLTPMDHRLTVVVYRAHNREAAVALYYAMMRDEWRDRKAHTQPGVTFVVLNTIDKSNPDVSGQRIYLQRGSYVIDVDEWKSLYRDAAGNPMPGRQFPHSRPIRTNVVVKAVTNAFPAG